MHTTLGDTELDRELAVCKDGSTPRASPPLRERQIFGMVVNWNPQFHKLLSANQELRNWPFCQGA